MPQNGEGKGSRTREFIPARELMALFGSTIALCVGVSWFITDKVVDDVVEVSRRENDLIIREIELLYSQMTEVENNVDLLMLYANARLRQLESSEDQELIEKFLMEAIEEEELELPSEDEER